MGAVLPKPLCTIMIKLIVCDYSKLFKKLEVLIMVITESY